MKKVEDKIRVKRLPKRGFYDKTTVYKILDDDFVCQVGFVYQNYPVVIPTIYGRKDDALYIHGASVSRMLVNLSQSVPISINVTKTDGIVLARSAFNHSLNYRSVTIFGAAKLVENKDEKLEALKLITNQIIPNRWDEVRLPNTKELKATSVLKIKINEVSAKIRKGNAGDDKPDYDLPIWAGVIPIKKHFGKPIADPVLDTNISIPQSVNNILKTNE